MGTEGAQGGLLEREAELGALSAALDALDCARGGSLLIEGPAGIGKTRLLEALVDEAGGRGIEPLSARAVALEATYPFGVAGELLRPIAEARATGDAGDGSAARALRAVRGEWGRDDELFPALHALFWLLTAVAADRPVLLAVDDIHWADEPTLRWLAYAVSRLEGTRILIAMAARPEPGGSALEELRSEPRIERIRPALLTVGGVARFVAERMRMDPDEALVAACAEVSGGNPFLLGELVAELAGRESVAPEDVKRLRPDSVSHAVIGRLASASPAAREIAQAVAVLGDDVALNDAAALAKVDEDDAAAAVEELERASVLAPGIPLRFAHPMLRDAVYEALSPARRAGAHARAARILRDRRAPAAAVAAQLLRTEPAGDGDAARLLLDAGRDATAFGDPSSALAFLERAAAEPVREADRCELLLGLGAAKAGAGKPGALPDLRAALARIEDPEQRADAAREAAGILSNAHQATEAFELLREVADDLERHGLRELRLRTEGDLCSIAVLRGDLIDSARRRAMPLAEGLEGRTAGERVLLAGVAALRDAAGDSLADTWRMAVAAIGDGDLLLEQLPDGNAFDLCGDLGMDSDRFDLVDPLYERWLKRASEAGSIVGMSKASIFLAVSAWSLGKLSEAEAHARAGLSAVRELGWSVGLPVAGGILVATLTDAGRLDDAERTLHDLGLDEDGDPEDRLHGYRAFHRARLHFARGRLEEALAEFLELGRRIQGGPLRGQRWGWRVRAAPLLAAKGDRDRALDLAREELEWAERMPGSYRGCALRTLGIVVGGEEGIEHLRESVATLENSPRRLERAEALLELGAMLRRANRRVESREPLRAALDLADRCGAGWIATRAREELAGSGLKPRRERISGPESLTPSEMRTARLAATGMSNAEIAQALFVTQKTVEKHLSQSYAKLEVDRAGLADALGPEPVEPA